MTNQAPEQLEDIRRSLTLLETLAANSSLTEALSPEDQLRLLKAAGKIAKPSRLERSRRAREERREKKARDAQNDRALRAATGIRTARQASVFVAPARALPPPLGQRPELAVAQSCYVCKAEYKRLHHFYDDLCPDCGDFNYEKRFQTADLSGRTAYVTGARLKIGFQAALKMLRAGARVIVSTRFPHDAAKRFTMEPDFKNWSDRLRVYGLDLRHSPSVEIFCRYLNQTESHLDALINNAAQTVRRPIAFYRHLLDYENLSWNSLTSAERGILVDHYACCAALGGTKASTEQTHALTSWDGGAVGLGLKESARLSQVRMTYDDRITAREIFPDGRLDADLQQVDLRTMNTWRMTLAEVPTPELLEVLLINAVAPFILAAKLKPLMLRGNAGDRHIVNVTAMEGIFSRGTKTDKHPHTNMAKAALNMLTLTSARDYEKSGLWMNAVDTGWVTDEDPAVHSLRKQTEHDFQPPLDIVDGAARILDPWFSGLNTGVHSSGRFLKDYKPANW